MADGKGPGTVQLPGEVVKGDGADLGQPTADLLRTLGLLPLQGESAGPTSAFTGTPDSLAVIEAGATALSKGWAAGMGAAIVACWSSVKIWYPDQGTDIQKAVILAAALATAALVLGIAYIVGSDVRGRAAASVATLDARARVAEAMIRQAGGLYKPKPPTAPAPPESSLVAISPPQEVNWRPPKGDDEPGWEASVMRVTGDKIEYRLTKGTESAWVPVDDIRFD